MVSSNSKIARNKAGLGGFIEAILAVMIITSGFTILMVSVNLVQSHEDMDVGEEVQGKVLAICKQLMGDERLFQQPYILLLSSSYLWSEVAAEELSSFEDYRITLIVDPTSPRSLLLAQKGSLSGSGDVVSVRVPVDIQITPSTVHVGILEVSVAP